MNKNLTHILQLAIKKPEIKIDLEDVEALAYYDILADEDKTIGCGFKCGCSYRVIKILV